MMYYLMNGFRIFSAALLIWTLCVETLLAEVIRKPVIAGLWYPSTQSDLKQMIDRLTLQSQKTRVQIPQDKPLKALILPHAGYIYSGLTAAHASLVLSEGKYSNVVLLGPDHRVGFRNGAISAVNAYQTPLGLIRLHKKATQLRLNSDLFQSSAASDRKEHSLEAVLPFLQYYLKEFELIPIVMGPGDINQLAEAIDPLMDENTLLVVSSDLSHFLTYRDAVVRDRETIDMILKRNPEELIERENAACGKIPLLILLKLARRHGWEPVLLHYSNSGDTAGDKDRVVGYATIAFFGESGLEGSRAPGRHQFNEMQGQDLIKLARLTIMNHLGRKVDDSEFADLKNALAHPCFQVRCGSFITLKKNGHLRGCIGNLSPTGSVLEGVEGNAIKAAFHDPRFKPLTSEELEEVDISVSILTQPQPLKYSDAQDLIANLHTNIDGVIIRKGNASATFLPQVWEQLPQPEKFLTHLCLKAGLPANAWQHRELKVWTYQVQYFEEKK
jgi:AmmeMemoRadiSam system protein B/AmmeMemoRadiSam system protein A